MLAIAHVTRNPAEAASKLLEGRWPMSVAKVLVFTCCASALAARREAGRVVHEHGFRAEFKAVPLEFRKRNFAHREVPFGVGISAGSIERSVIIERVHGSVRVHGSKRVDRDDAPAPPIFAVVFPRVDCLFLASIDGERDEKNAPAIRMGVEVFGVVTVGKEVAGCREGHRAALAAGVGVSDVVLVVHKHRRRRAFCGVVGQVFLIRGFRLRSRRWRLRWGVRLWRLWWRRRRRYSFMRAVVDGGRTSALFGSFQWRFGNVKSGL